MADPGIIMVVINAVRTAGMRQRKILYSVRNVVRDYRGNGKECIGMWKIKQIAEADFGCEERLPGEKLKCLVILENENGETRRLEVEDEWLTEQGLDEGSTWNIE